MTLKGHSAGVMNISFSPDGKTLAYGSKQGVITLRDLESGKTTATSYKITGMDGVSFSPDGRFLAYGSADSTISLWDLANEKQKQHLRGT